MLVLRATRKLLPGLGGAADAPAGSNTALGDWYANRFVVDRRPLLLLVSASSFLPMLIPAREVRGVPCLAGKSADRVAWPEAKARELLLRRWGG